MTKCFDVVGVGFGPANLALAVAIEEEAPRIERLFLELEPKPVWQSEMLLANTDIQNHPCRDLVTLRNPRSRYSFLNYLFECGRIIQYLNFPRRFPLRKEYTQYIAWVADQFFDVVKLESRIVGISIEQHQGNNVYVVTSDEGHEARCRSLILGTGRSENIPSPFRTLDSESVFHTQQYLSGIKALSSHPRAITVIGGSQSAVEVILDLMKRFPEASICNYVRSYSLRLKDSSPFSEEGFFPEFIDYYYSASRSSKQVLDSYMHPTNYSCVDQDILEELYVQIYEQRLDGQQRVFVLCNRQVCSAVKDGDRVQLEIEEVHTKERERVEFDLVILATGYRDLGPRDSDEAFPPLLSDIIDRFHFTEDGYLKVNKDYSLCSKEDKTPPVFLNGLCESTHGIGDAGSFSLLSLRAITILNGIRRRIGMDS